MILPLIWLSQEIDSRYFKDFTAFKTSKISPLKGLYKRTNRWGLYQAFEFKGKNTVIIHSMKFKFGGKYELDENIIRVTTGNSGSDLILYIKNSKTLIGEGVAKGTYIKN